MNEQDKKLEALIQQEGCTAPRITPEHIEGMILQEHYFTADAPVEAMGNQAHPSLKLLTICVLVLENGFTVTGESACASPENFRANVGREAARNQAINKIWMLEGYSLRKELHKLFG